MRAIFSAILCSMLTSAAFGQVSLTEEIEYADRQLAVEAGYAIEVVRDHKGTPERQYVDDTFMKPIVDRYGRDGLPYGFGFIWRDLTGDGLEDLILVPKMAGLFPPEEYLDDPGAAVFVYVRTDDGWDLAIEAGTMSIGLRSGEVPGSTDIAFVQTEHMDEFFWDGSEFVRRARRLP